MKLPLGVRDSRGEVIHHNDVLENPFFGKWLVRPRVERRDGSRDGPPYVNVGWFIPDPAKSTVIGNIEDDPTLLDDPEIMKRYADSNGEDFDVTATSGGPE